MKVVFRVDSSQQIGSGHVMRCLTLAERFRSKKNAEVIFLMRDLNGNLIDLVKKQEYKVNVLPRSAHEYELSGYEAWLTVPQELDAEQSIGCISDKGFVDLLVVDSYAIDIIWENKLRPYSKKIMVIDDLANRRHNCDILLDQNLYENQDRRYFNLVPEWCRLFLGPQYALLRQEFYDSKKCMKIRSGELRNIFVFFGGVDITNETQKALNAISLVKYDKFEVNVVVGTGNPHKEEIELLCSYHNNWHYYVQVNNMAEFMAKADLAIGAGGTTTWERCFLGLPSIIIAVADNQTLLSQCCEKRGIVIYLGLNVDVGVRDIASVIDGLNRDSLYNMSKSCEGLMGDGKGIKELFEIC